MLPTSGQATLLKACMARSGDGWRPARWPPAKARGLRAQPRDWLRTGPTNAATINGNRATLTLGWHSLEAAFIKGDILGRPV